MREADDMTGHRPDDEEQLKTNWDERARGFDDWFQTFQGAVEQQVDWELLRPHLPANREARILDAAGGTGRITLRLAQMGYTVTLCDISPGMLAAARRKLASEQLLEKVQLVECDIRNLPFVDESFDFVLCWDHGMEAVSELARVTKPGGTLSVAFVNRCRAAIDAFRKDAATAVSLIRAESTYTEDEHGRYRVTSPEEARAICEAAGLRVLENHGMYGWMEVLGIPDDVAESRTWDEGALQQTVDMLLHLSREPSIQGMAVHLIVYAAKT